MIFPFHIYNGYHNYLLCIWSTQIIQIVSHTSRIILSMVHYYWSLDIGPLYHKIKLFEILFFSIHKKRKEKEIEFHPSPFFIVIIIIYYCLSYLSIQIDRNVISVFNNINKAVLVKSVVHSLSPFSRGTQTHTHNSFASLSLSNLFSSQLCSVLLHVLTTTTHRSMHRSHSRTRSVSLYTPFQHSIPVPFPNHICLLAVAVPDPVSSHLISQTVCSAWGNENVSSPSNENMGRSICKFFFHSQN